MQQPKKRKVVCKLFVWFFFNTFYYVGLFYFIFIIPVYSQFANFFFFTFYKKMNAILLYNYKQMQVTDWLAGFLP